MLLFEGFSLEQLQDGLRVTETGNGLTLDFQGTTINLDGLTQEDFTWDFFVAG